MELEIQMEVFRYESSHISKRNLNIDDIVGPRCCIDIGDVVTSLCGATVGVPCPLQRPAPAPSDIDR